MTTNPPTWPPRTPAESDAALVVLRDQTAALWPLAWRIPDAEADWISVDIPGAIGRLYVWQIGPTTYGGMLGVPGSRGEHNRFANDGPLADVLQSLRGICRMHGQALLVAGQAALAVVDDPQGGNL